MIRKKYYSSMVFLLVLSLLLALLVVPQTIAADPIIADHNATDITAIPQSAIEAAKATLSIAYGHTSHGSQLTTGMSSLVGFANNGGKGLSLPADIFAYNNGGSDGALDLRDGPFSNAADLGNPNLTAWAGSTRTYLNSHPEVNVIIWSWCGQVTDATAADIDTYLNLMNGLETDYPNVQFVYMTGHLDGSGLSGNLHLRNEQIRNYCITNDKILYDFADIESYDPDGLVNYNVLLANDACSYDSDSNGLSDRNWAIDWQDTHTQGLDWYTCSSAHSQPLNANQKAYAAWWLWARLAGWGECASAPNNLSAVSNSDLGEITLNWSDNSDNEDSFIIQRQVDGGAWDNAYDTVAGDITLYTDAALVPGTYHYRVVAHRTDDGSGNPCDSGYSNTAQGQITDPDLPVAPSALITTADSVAGSITLNWTDNAINESGFTIQRQVNGGAWDDTYDSVGANVTSFLDSGLTSGTYNYRVIAVNPYGDSNPSNTATASIVQSIPLAPSNLTSAVNGLDITLSWEDNSDTEDRFVVERSIDGAEYGILVNDLPPNAHSHTDTNLQPGHTYTYRVKAENSFGSSAYSNPTDQFLYAATVTITLNNDDAGEVIDAFLIASSADTNYGGTAYASTYDRFIIQFNLPAELLGKRVLSAELGFYVWAVDPSDAGTPLDLYPVTQPWEEASVTWNHAANDTPWQTPGGSIGESVGQVVVEDIDHDFLTPLDITDTVQQWIDGTTANFGLILDKGQEVGMAIKASEYSQTSSTYLTITYTHKTCFDYDLDGDTDGEDLALLSGTFDPSCLITFATNFGQTMP